MVVNDKYKNKNKFKVTNNGEECILMDYRYGEFHGMDIPEELLCQINGVEKVQIYDFSKTDHYDIEFFSRCMEPFYSLVSAEDQELSPKDFEYDDNYRIRVFNTRFLINTFSRKYKYIIATIDKRLFIFEGIKLTPSH